MEEVNASPNRVVLGIRKDCSEPFGGWKSFALHYMRTIEDCLNEEAVFRLRVKLTFRQQPSRLLMVAPGVRQWMSEVMLHLRSDDHVMGAIAPHLQATAAFRRFIVGEEFEPPLPHEMTPKGHGVWRFRTDDLRFDGWFPKRGAFVIAAAATKEESKGEASDRMFDEVVRFRRELNMLDGTFLTGELHELL